MQRGTFANIRLVNKFIGKAGPKTIHIPSNQEVQLLVSEWLPGLCLHGRICLFHKGSKYIPMALFFDTHVFISQMSVFDAAEKYRSEGRSLIILAGKDYGSGSSRDWAAKGPWILVRLPFHVPSNYNNKINNDLLCSGSNVLISNIICNFRVSKQLLLKVTKEFIAVIWLVWELYRFSTCLSRTQKA